MDTLLRGQRMLEFLKGTPAEPIHHISNLLVNSSNDKDKTKVKNVAVKDLCPNGRMRRETTRDIIGLYKLYIIPMLILIISQIFIGSDAIEVVISDLKDMAKPLTTAFLGVTTSSYLTNMVNTIKGK